jgi:uncharacterized membrane protein
MTEANIQESGEMEMSERQEKRAQFNAKRSTGKKLLIPIIVLALVAVAAGSWLFTSQQSLGAHTMIQAGQDGVIRFAAADFTDGKAKFYRFNGQSGPVNFFVVRSQDGVIRAAFDTCDVCYRERKGYRQEGNDMVCNNCDQHFRTDLVNVVKGGCNPAPLKRQEAGNMIVIAVNDLEQGSGYFRTMVN